MPGEETAKKVVSGGGFKSLVNRGKEIDEAVEGSSKTPSKTEIKTVPRISARDLNDKLDRLIADTERRKARERQDAERKLSEEDIVEPQEERPRNGGWKDIPGLGRVRVD